MTGGANPFRASMAATTSNLTGMGLPGSFMSPTSTPAFSVGKSEQANTLGPVGEFGTIIGPDPSKLQQPQSGSLM
jgi:hypothetical protein